MSLTEKALIITFVVFILVMVVAAKYISSDSQFQDFCLGWFFSVAGSVLVACGAWLIKSCFTT